MFAGTGRIWLEHLPIPPGVVHAYGATRAFKEVSMRSPGIGKLATVAGLVWMTSGCYHFRVAPIRSTPADDGHSVTQHALLWGMVQPRAEQPECQGNGAAEVTATTNLGYTLISVVTLGIWMPIEIEWKCAKDQVRPETGLD